MGLAVERDLTIDDLYRSRVVSIHDNSNNELTILLATKLDDGSTRYQRFRISRKFLNFIYSFCEAETIAKTNSGKDSKQLDLLHEMV